MIKVNEHSIYRGLLGMEISSDFRQRLSSKADWNAATAKAVDFEYRCFLLLCAISDVPMTPPEAVDIAWHEHILHTRHYQDVLPGIIGKRLHHDPGGEMDADKYRRQYQYTWRLYRRVFGRDPTDLIWPRPQARITDLFRRIENVDTNADLTALWVLATMENPAYVSASPSSRSSYQSSTDTSVSDTSVSNTASSCGTSCGGGCGGD